MNRQWTLGALVAAAVLLTGCDMFSPKTASPATGQQVTLGQLQAEEVAAERKAAAEAASEALRAQAELAKVQRDAEFQLTLEQSATDQRIAEIAFEAANKMEGVRVDLATSAESLRAAIEAMRANYAAARADIEDKAGFMADLAGIAQAALGGPAVQGAAAANPLIAAAVGLGGILFGRWSKAKASEQDTKTQLATLRSELSIEAKRLEDAAWDEAKREAAEAQRATDAAWDQSQGEAERRMLLSLAAKAPAA